MSAAQTGVPISPRRLTTGDLIIYGIVLIQPIAPVGIFGIANRVSNGHVTTSILFAMVAMAITALSYGRLAALYPSAGSAYTYVGRSFHPLAGYMVGWAMFLDYLIIPVISTIYAALTLQRLMPSVPFVCWAVLFAATITALNLAGVRSLARANKIMLLIMTVVIAAFVLLSLHFLYGRSGWAGVFSIKPVYDRATFHFNAVMTATSLAALTYIGFDGVTTLAEEVRNPRRSVPMATVLVCLLTGVFSAVEVYLAQRVWPDYHTFRNLETAFLDVTRVVGGNSLFQAMGLILVIASVGSGLTGQAAAARLLYVMGRDNVMPKHVFGRWDTRRRQPSWNIWLIGTLAVAGALLMSYERTAELLNFGAFLAFMGVNLAAIQTLWFGGKSDSRNLITGIFLPLAGFLFCLAIWWSLPVPAKVAGGIWLGIGLAQIAIKSRGFRSPIADIRFGEA
ncbi:MAG TPA: APC family permease [Bryobacteraceae bacterium]|jgi:amino acid transporter